MKAHYMGVILGQKMYFLKYILYYYEGNFSFITYGILINM